MVITKSAYQKRLKRSGFTDQNDAGPIAQPAHACDPVSRRMQALGVDPFANGSYMLPVKGDEFQKYCKFITREELRNFRNEHYLSRSDLARFFGVKETQIRRWLARGKNPDDFLPVSRNDFARLEAEYSGKTGSQWRALMKKAGLQ